MLTMSVFYFIKLFIIDEIFISETWIIHMYIVELYNSRNITLNICNYIFKIKLLDRLKQVNTQRMSTGRVHNYISREGK